MVLVTVRTVVGATVYGPVEIERCVTVGELIGRLEPSRPVWRLQTTTLDIGPEPILWSYLGNAKSDDGDIDIDNSATLESVPEEVVLTVHYKAAGVRRNVAGSLESTGPRRDIEVAMSPECRVGCDPVAAFDRFGIKWGFCGRYKYVQINNGKPMWESAGSFSQFVGNFRIWYEPDFCVWRCGNTEFSAGAGMASAKSNADEPPEGPWHRHGETEPFTKTIYVRFVEEPDNLN